ncbi:MAG: hypothetical protein P4L56_29720 [Candidatus Sulfopaludibacter sp.]|nr:hypothetical protein [Candidatus Sulfopaludibacter sp.]
MAEEKSTTYLINTAFVGISRRAESVDRKTLVQTFVDLGPLIPVLSSRDHQIVYGRRGTGKTHALLYVTEQLRTDRTIPVYVDLRNMGSSGGMYSDTQIPVTQRATRLLLDVLGTVHEGLIEHAVNMDLDLSVLGPVLDTFAQSITELEVVGEVHRETKLGTRADREESSALRLVLSDKPSVDVGVTSTDKSSSQAESSLEESGPMRYRVHFGSVGKALGELAKTLNPARILVVLDEWSTIPLELQPYLADLIRRAVFPVAGITVKIAAIEQRSNFKIGPHGDYTGIEIGADASADVDLDDYMVFDNNADRALEFFQELLFKHYASEAGSRPEFQNSNGLIQAAFTQRNAFEDFVRAAEGVPRDAFNVLSIAAQRSLNDKISIPTIRVAARTWFQRDKEGAVRSNSEAEELLHWIIDEVIAHRRARAFLLRSNTRHPLIDALFDARLLHVIKKSISGHDEPGARYDVYKLDYGCYVDLLATTKAPDKLLDTEDPGASVSVPSDDYRAIRRAILDLDRFRQRGRALPLGTLLGALGSPPAPATAETESASHPPHVDE